MKKIVLGAAVAALTLMGSAAMAQPLLRRIRLWQWRL